MKATFAALSLLAICLLTSACEQHKWSETQKLFQEHEAPGHEAAGHEGSATNKEEKKAEPAPASSEK